MSNISKLTRMDGSSEAGSPLILVAEHNQLNRKLTCDLLRSKGYKVLEVGNSRMILEAARQNKPDLVLLDAAWPEAKTANIVKKFRQDHALDKIPVIALTAANMDDDDFDAYCNDYDRLISMPASIMSVIRMVDIILSKVKKYALR